MPLPKPTMNLRWRKIKSGEIPEYGRTITIYQKWDVFGDSEPKRISIEYVLEQQFRIETIEGVEFVWKSIPIAENEK